MKITFMDRVHVSIFTTAPSVYTSYAYMGLFIKRVGWLRVKFNGCRGTIYII